MIGNAVDENIGIAYAAAMNDAIERAVKQVGSQAALATRLGIKQPTVSEWARGERPVPPERCVAIEQATAAAVRRWDLRPDDWHRIWPELIGVEGAPPLAEPTEAKAA